MKSGARIFGSKPQKSPSLQNFPECDTQVAQLANELWNTNLIKEGSILDYLKNGSLLPDFSIEKGSREKIDYIHRKANDSDIYFIANSKKESRVERCRFRISGKQPGR